MRIIYLAAVTYGFREQKGLAFAVRVNLFNHGFGSYLVDSTHYLEEWL